MNVVVPPTSAALAGRLMRVLGKRAHERQINVDVRIDESGKDIFAGGVDHFRAGRGRNVFVDARDGFVLAKNIGHVALAAA